MNMLDLLIMYNNHFPMHQIPQNFGQPGNMPNFNFMPMNNHMIHPFHNYANPRPYDFPIPPNIHDFGNYYQQPYLPPIVPSSRELPQITMEINIVLNDENIEEMTKKLPYLKILIEKGIIKKQQNMTNPNQQNNHPTIANNSQVIQQPTMALNCQFTELKHDIQKHFDNEMGKKKITIRNLIDENSCNDEVSFPNPNDKLNHQVKLNNHKINQDENDRMFSFEKKKIETPPFVFLQNMEIALPKMFETNVPHAFQSLAFQTIKLKSHWLTKEFSHLYIFKKRKQRINKKTGKKYTLEIVDYSKRVIQEGEIVSEEIIRHNNTRFYGKDQKYRKTGKGMKE